jgi:hypothetical protein
MNNIEILCLIILVATLPRLIVNIIIDDKERTQLEQKRKIIESRKKKDGD